MRLIVCLTTDNGKSYIVSDESWKTTKSPISYSSIYGGEDYDARMVDKSWLKPGYDDSSWQTPIVTAPATMHLHSQPGQHLHIATTLPPQNISVTPEGHYLYDLGQNFSGIPQISVRGKKGDIVTLRPGELSKDGAVSQQSTGSPHYYCYTIGTTDSIESWHPQFTYFGLRYIQVEGAVPAATTNPDSLPEIIDIVGLHTTSDTPVSGSFECSNQLFNNTFRLVDWAMRSNMASILTDCPHREKLGWLEEANLMQQSLQYRYNMSTLYPKIMSDIASAQLDNGCVPTIAPEFVRFSDGFEDTPEWGSTAIISPWYFYKWYGDPSLLQEYYTTMQRYLDYLQSRADDNIIAYGLGDWYDIGPNPPGYAQLTSNGVTATATYYYNATIMRETAALLRQKADEMRYDSLAREIKQAYNRRFFNESTGSYDTGSQTANAISLALGLVEDKNRRRVLDALVADIEERDYALTAGDVGYRYVLAALAEGNRADVVYKMNSRYDKPGYGWQLAHGATTLTESWQAYESTSNNHFMLGHIMEWFFSALGGIRQSAESMGFNTIDIKPQPCGDVKWARTSIESPRGKISSEWYDTINTFTLNATIPANTQARIWLPSISNDNISEHGMPLAKTEGIRYVEIVKPYTIVTVGSGSYSFLVDK